MRRENDEPSESCAICHEELEGESALDYRVSASTILCHECAKKRGGVYSPEKETWIVPPRLPKRDALRGEEP